MSLKGTSELGFSDKNKEGWRGVSVDGEEGLYERGVG